LRERGSKEPAEGATSPETLRQKDCNKLKKSGEKLRFIRIENNNL